MSMSDSGLPVHERPFLFVIGAPRSGTSWLHQMLSQHPSIAATEREELTVFSRYLAPWAGNYDMEARNNAAGKWRQGLPCLMDEAEFTGELHGFIDRVYGKLLVGKPGALVLMDKHPNYSNHIPLIARLLPQSRFVHLIRDGREVAVSMMSVRQRVGHSPGEIRGATREWHRCLSNARAAGSALGPDRYLEVRYEELRGDAMTWVRRVFEFAGTPIDDELVRRITEEHHISRKQVSHGDPKLNRLRERPGAIWREGLSLRERYVFDRMAGRLLEQLGYAAPGWWATGPLDRLFMSTHGVFTKLHRTVLDLRRTWAAPAEERLP